MDPSLKNLLIFSAVALAGMLAHYVKSWVKGEISGNLIDYLFRDNPRSTVAALGGVLGATATAYLTGALDGLALKTLLPLAFTAGFSLDSAFNKGGSASVIGTAVKQGGFSKVGILTVLAIGAMAATCFFASCAVTPSSVAYDAQVTADQAVKSIPGLLQAHAITGQQAQRIVDAADTVNAAAAAAEAPNASQAQQAAVAAALSELMALIPQPPHK